ncbi:MAG: iron-containing alcohol dehydrogenase family protein [Lachnospiraceae bacterium]
MSNWLYTQPVDIMFGEGEILKIKELATKLSVSNGMLVSDPFFTKNGLADKIIEQAQGVVTTIYSDVSPNPDVSEVDACAKQIRAQKIDFVIALGGGSALDLAKAAASVCLTENSIKEYHGTGIAMPLEHLPIIAVPTTAGTGSEVTCVSVLTDHSNGKKSPIVSNGFYPTYAIIDPELTYTMPPYITASTGIDVLSHALEGYWSKGNQPICDALAIHALKLVFEYLPKAYANGEDKVAREKMCEASLIAGLAFTLPKTTSSHACSFPLTNIYKIPHGEACGLTLDYFARINNIPRVQSLATELGFADVNEMADAILKLKKDIKLRTDLCDFNLTDAQVDELVTISRHPNLYNNPVEITDDMLYELYNSLK